MANSAQVVGQDAVFVNDLDLLLLLRLMAEHVTSSTAQFSSLQLLADRWKLCWECYGPGTIDLELAEIASDPSKKSEFLCLTNELTRRLRREGAIWDRAMINQRWGISGIEFSDYSPKDLALTLKELQALMEASA